MASQHGLILLATRRRNSMPEKLPEEHRALAEGLLQMSKTSPLPAERLELATQASAHASLGILAALLQFERCDHGTRGFCVDCLVLKIGRIG